MRYLLFEKEEMCTVYSFNWIYFVFFINVLSVIAVYLYLKKKIILPENEYYQLNENYAKRRETLINIV